MADLSKVNDGNFQEFTSQAGLVLVDYGATWCGPCKKLNPVLEEIQGERPDIRIGKVDIEEARQAAMANGVMSVPQVHFYLDGKKVDQFLGYQDKAKVLALINKHRGA
jgi:thioredoxin 1